MLIIQDLIPASARNRPGTRQTPRKIVVHETANTSRGANAEMHGRYVKGQDARNRSVSWHYTVDDKEVRQHLPDNERGWHAGSGNPNSIGIESCVNSDGNWGQTKRKGQQLIAFLMQRWGIPLSAVETHQAQTGKNCPANLLREGFQSFKRGISTVEQVESITNNPWWNRQDDEVKELQKKLFAVGEKLPKHGADGHFGDETLKAVQSFQRKHGISQPGGNHYGVPGPQTMAKLDELIGEDEYVDINNADFASNQKAVRDLVRRYGVSDMEAKLEKGELKKTDLYGALAKAAMSNGSSRSNPSDVHAPAVNKADEQGIMVAGRPGEYVTREQLATILDRTGNLD